MNLSNPLNALLAALSLPLQRRMARLVYPPGTQLADFQQPPGEAALLMPDSLSWRIFANPIAMFVGGVTAVLLELAEPSVRSGVWEHTTFRDQPMLRLQRTGYAAMMTTFGARSRAEQMIRRVNARHAQIAGRTPRGASYSATDPELLTWVHATATYGFLRAYGTCVHALSASERDRFFAENQSSARLYGVPSPPDSEMACAALFDAMAPRLERSPIVFEFIAIMQRLPLLPPPLRFLQSMLLRAAIGNLPEAIRHQLGLDDAHWHLSSWQWRLLRTIGRAVDDLSLPSLPANLARKRTAAGAAPRTPPRAV